MLAEPMYSLVSRRYGSARDIERPSIARYPLAVDAPRNYWINDKDCNERT
jgi:hypothetical protein